MYYIKQLSNSFEHVTKKLYNKYNNEITEKNYNSNLLKYK